MQSYGTPSIGIRAIKPVSPVKIGWVAQNDTDFGPLRIRVVNVNKVLRSMGYNSSLTTYENIITQNYDIAIVGKGFDEYNYQSVKILKEHKKLVFADLCEDILKFHFVKEILEICDRVICCSHELERKVRSVNPRTVVIEDAWET